MQPDSWQPTPEEVNTRREKNEPLVAWWRGHVTQPWWPARLWTERGVVSGDFYGTRVLARSMGGMWGGSRAIVDDGWIDSSRQVGLTGKITRPGLYLAAGISGASQHMAGCSAAKTIVAINKDKDASIYRYARYGIVADCLEVLPELIKAARA